MSELAFEERISKIVEDKLSSESIDLIVENMVEDAIKSCLEDCFMYGSESSKLLRSKFDSIMVKAIENHDFNKYLVKLDTVLTQIVTQTSLSEHDSLLRNFKSLMKEENFGNIDLYKVFESYCEMCSMNVDISSLNITYDDEEEEDIYEDIHCHMDLDYNTKGDFLDVTMFCDEDSELDRRLCLWRSSKGWELLSTSGNTIELRSLSTISDFDILIFKIKRSFSYIDIDNPDLDVYEETVKVNERPGGDF